jgi:hypothetical protein
VPKGHVLAQVTYPNHEKTVRVLRVDADDFYRWFTTSGEELRVEGGLL